MNTVNPSPRSDPGTLVTGCGFLEGPRWHGGRLWFSDLLTGLVSAVRADGSTEDFEVPGRPSGLGFLPDGRLLVVTMEERLLYRHEGGRFVVHADLDPVISGICNDMVVDGTGNAYVGGTGLQRLGDVPDGAPPPGEIVLVRPDGASSIVDRGTAIPNGLAVTADRATLVVAESGAARITAFDIHADGTLTGKRRFAALAGCVPDGLCLDADGAAWVADATGARCLRVAEGGTVLDEIGFDHPVVSCTLGGPAGTTLFAVGAMRLTFNPDRPRTGLVRTVEVDVPGAGWP